MHGELLTKANILRESTNFSSKPSHLATSSVSVLHSKMLERKGIFAYGTKLWVVVHTVKENFYLPLEIVQIFKTKVTISPC